MTFEEKLFSGKNSKARLEGFRNSCRAIFASAEGRHVLAMLCGAAHPLEHGAGLSDHEHGQREVVATLWRYGSTEAALPST